MGILTDFVIADPAEAERVCASHPSDRRFQWFQTKGVTQPAVAALCAAAFGQPFDPAAPWPDSLAEDLAGGGEDEPGLYQVPPELVARLAGLDRTGRESVAEQWAATGTVTPEGSMFVIGGLADLCQRAGQQGKAVLLLVCL